MIFNFKFKSAALALLLLPALTYCNIFSSVRGAGVFSTAVLKDKHLLSKPSSNIFVTLTQSLDPVYQRIRSQSFPDREAKFDAIYQSLRHATSGWHQGVLQSLQPFGVETYSLWISNQIYVKNANPRVVQHLLGLPVVKSVREEMEFPLENPINPIPRAGRPTETAWGVKRIGAEEVWKNGTRGNGIRVLIIDSGVNVNHEALKDNYVGKGGWYDPINPLIGRSPSDRIGHGTHCAGTICGKYGIGVSPDSLWSACRGCDVPGTCPEIALMKCGEWSTTVTPRPHVVSCSWGGSGGNTHYNDVIKAWNEGGIIGVFAIGNSGPDCSSAGSPGDQPGIISVGSTNITDTMSSYSSRGPKKEPDGQVAPLIAAPGERIVSAFIRTNSDYFTMDGTSMACPHVSGAVAALLSYKNNLTLDQIKALLFNTTFQEVEDPAEQCGANPINVYPNEMAGYGRLDLAAAYKKLVESS